MDSAEFQVRGRQMVNFIIQYLEVVVILMVVMVVMVMMHLKYRIPNYKYQWSGHRGSPGDPCYWAGLSLRCREIWYWYWYWYWYDIDIDIDIDINIDIDIDIDMILIWILILSLAISQTSYPPPHLIILNPGRWGPETEIRFDDPDSWPKDVKREIWFDDPDSWPKDVMRDVEDKILVGMTHWQHPRWKLGHLTISMIMKMITTSHHHDDDHQVPRLLPRGQLLSLDPRRHALRCHRMCRILLGILLRIVIIIIIITIIFTLWSWSSSSS